MSRVMVDPQSLPASFISPGDISQAWPGMAPGAGDVVVPHIISISGRIGLRAYQWADEALRDSRVNAEKMRTDCGIMESVEALQRSVSLLNWHIVPEDDQSLSEKQLADEMTRIIRRTPDFTKLRWSCADSHWYGRAAVFPRFGKAEIGSRMRTYIKGWEPRHGDKLVFRWDDGSHENDPDQVGIRVTAGYHEIPGAKWTDQFGRQHSQIEASQYGLVYWFTKEQRERIIVDKHIIEDCVFEDPQRAGGIHGTGIRDRIYWTWYGMIECLADVLSYLERSAFGVEIWTYPAGNDQARQRTEAAAKNQTSGGRTVLVVPKERGEGAEDFGVQHIEPGLGGIESAMSLIQNFFMHKIKRYILGQTLTSEAAATGLGSGVADAHMATFADIIKFLAVCREETLTRDLLRPLQIWNFPQSRGIYLRFAIDTESPDSDKKMQGYQAAWQMGAALKTEEVMSIIGASMPKDTDKVLQNPAFQQQPMQIPGQGIEGAGQDAAGGQPGSLQDMFGPLANELGGGEAGAQGGAGGPPGGGNGQPPSPTEGGGPTQYAFHVRDENGEFERKIDVTVPDIDVEKYARKRQVQSTPGQQPLGGIPDLNTKQHHLWKEELHPRDEGGQWTDTGGSSKQTQAAGALGRSAPSHQFGQGMLFHELASKLHQSEESVEPHEKSQQKDIFDLLAKSDVPQEQLAALLSGDHERMDALRNHAHATGQAELPADHIADTDEVESTEPPPVSSTLAPSVGPQDTEGDTGGFELQRSKTREGAPAETFPETGGRQENFWHGMKDKPGQGQMFEGMDLAGHNTAMMDSARNIDSLLAKVKDDAYSRNGREVWIDLPKEHPLSNELIAVGGRYSTGAASWIIPGENAVASLDRIATEDRQARERSLAQQQSEKDAALEARRQELLRTRSAADFKKRKGAYWRIHRGEFTSDDLHDQHESELWVGGSDSDNAKRRGLSAAKSLNALASYFAGWPNEHSPGRGADFEHAHLVQLYGDKSEDDPWEESEGEALIHPKKLGASVPLENTDFIDRVRQKIEERWGGKWRFRPENQDFIQIADELDESSERSAANRRAISAAKDNPPPIPQGAIPPLKASEGKKKKSSALPERADEAHSGGMTIEEAIKNIPAKDIESGTRATIKDHAARLGVGFPQLWSDVRSRRGNEDELARQRGISTKAAEDHAKHLKAEEERQKRLESADELSKQIHDLLIKSGATFRTESDSGSRYYDLPDGTPVRVSDHQANGPTSNWLGNSNGEEIDLGGRNPLAAAQRIVRQYLEHEE